jgi:hypothetical protein
MRRSLVLPMLALLALPLRSPAGQTIDTTLLSEGMWAGQIDARTIRLAWNHVSGVSDYTVSCAAGTRPSKQISSISAGTLAPKDANGLPRRMSAMAPVNEMNTPYLCSLRWSSGGKTGPSGSLSFNPITPTVPGTARTAPTSVTARVTAPGQITVEWSEVPGATASIIARAVAPEGFRTICDFCSTSTSFVDRDVRPGLKHRYTVSVAAPGGTSARVASNEVVAAGSAQEVVEAGDPRADSLLKPPSSVRASVTGPASIALTWKSVKRATAYEVFRSVKGGALQSIGRVNASTSDQIEYSDYLGGVIADGSSASVRYAVKSIDAQGATTTPSNSNDVMVDMKAAVGAGSTSSAASNTRATATSADAVTLTWNPPAIGIPCRLERSLSGGSYAALPPLSSGTNKYVDAAPGLLDQRPRYRITCGDVKSGPQTVAFPIPEWTRVGSEADAASGSATMPTNLRAVATSPQSVTLTWGPPTSPIACVLRRSVNAGSYVPLARLTIGAWKYVDTADGLREMRPRYQLACGDPKSATAASFPVPF